MRTVRRLGLMLSILAGAFVFAVFAPARALAASPGALPAVASEAGVSGESSANTPDEAAPDHVEGLMVMADFNRDGVPDIAEASPAGDPSGPGLLKVSLGQSDGAFKLTASDPVLGHAPRSIVVADFNGDGISDLMVGDDDGALMLFLGDGTGKMVPAGDVAHLESVVSIAVADFNHDGIPDLAVSDWRANAVTVLLGAGSGSFRRAWSLPVRMTSTAQHLVTADFNGDGIPDLAVVYEGDDGATFEVMLGDGKGFFTDAPNLSFVKDPNSHCAT